MGDVSVKPYPAGKNGTGNEFNGHNFTLWTTEVTFNVFDVQDFLFSSLVFLPFSSREHLFKSYTLHIFYLSLNIQHSYHSSSTCGFGFCVLVQTNHLGNIVIFVSLRTLTLIFIFF